MQKLRTRGGTAAVIVTALVLSGIVGSGIAANGPSTFAGVAVACTIGILVWRPAVGTPLTLLIAFTTLPAAVPTQFQAGATIYFFEPTLVFSALWGIWVIPRRSRIRAHMLALLAVLVAWGVAGILLGHLVGPLIADTRGLLDLALAIPAVAAVYLTGKSQYLVVAAVASQYISAMFTLLSSFTGLELQGRTAVSSFTTASNDDPTRLLTQAGFPALALVCFVLVLISMGSIRAHVAIVTLAPAVVILFFSFSRGTILGILAAVGIAILGLLRMRRIASGVIRFALYGVVLGASLYGALLAVGPEVANGWIGGQVTTYINRVFGGITSAGLSADPSAQYRVSELNQLIAAIRDAPFLGHGFGFAYQPPAYSSGAFGQFTAGSAQWYGHQYYAWLIVKVGAVGALPVLAVFFAPIVEAVRVGSVRALPPAAALAGLLAVSTVAPVPEGVPESTLIGGLIAATWFLLGPQVEESELPDQTTSVGGRSRIGSLVVE